VTLDPTRRLLDHLDIWLAALVALAAVASVGYDLAPVLRTLLAAPLVLFLPGYALLSLLFPAPIIPAVERVLLSAGGSIAVAILSGLALAWAGVSLSPVSWSVTLAVITLVGLAFTWLRRVRRGLTGPSASFATMPRLGALMVLVAVLGALNVLAGSRLVASEQASPAPAELWMVPIAGQPNEVQLGMRAGASGGQYAIRLSASGIVIHEFTVSVAAEQSWTTRVDFSSDARALPIVARLYEDGSDSEIRYVVLQPVTNASP
jgi:hypothetical protein